MICYEGRTKKFFYKEFGLVFLVDGVAFGIQAGCHVLPLEITAPNRFPTRRTDESFNVRLLMLPHPGLLLGNWRYICSKLKYCRANEGVCRSRREFRSKTTGPHPKRQRQSRDSVNLLELTNNE